jgi:hypothetical protein
MASGFRGEPKAFTLEELIEAAPCVHSITDQGCAACVRHIFWYQGRVAGLDEAVEVLAGNTAILDSIDKVAKRHH